MNNETIKEYIFEIGQNNTTKKREIKKAEQVLFNFGLGGFNIGLTNGFWIDRENNNKVYVEKSYKICFKDLDNTLNLSRAKLLKEKLKDVLKQEEILLTFSEQTIL